MSTKQELIEQKDAAPGTRSSKDGGDGDSLANQENAGQRPSAKVDDGRPRGASSADEDSGVVTVAVEDLLAAGIDVENLSTITQEELAKVIAMVKRNPVNSGSGQRQKKLQQESVVTNVIVEEIVERPVAPPCTSNPRTSQENDPWSLVVTDEGSIRLTDSQNHVYLFTREVLQTHDIDPNNLTEDNIQSLLALALPVHKMASAEEPAAKRAKLRNNPSYIIADPASHLSKQSQEYSVIGEDVEVRKENKLLPATVRYCREGPGPNYKVQFPDGHFEWVDENQITLPMSKITPPGGAGRSPFLTSMTGIPLKLSADPGHRVNVVSRYTPPDDEPNYCCQVCDKKVFQKEPTFIVIRIPACHSCAEKQMFILDENEVIPTKYADQRSPSQQMEEQEMKERKTNSAPLVEIEGQKGAEKVQQRSASIDCCPGVEDTATTDDEALLTNDTPTSKEDASPIAIKEFTAILIRKCQPF
ncbi:hypothetical protein L596_002799 [Steinernema carpocapsae]|uniref:Uncharacterized protein n=1 Tax=Steinernema carpocapsae TaxID=34508 RepID=A0A4U8US55_STECR|nr:hypothetical protein L596_002799 [Steinernema carpocapsae]